MNIFENFGFQMVVATPLKSVMTLEPFIGGACFVEISGRHDSGVLLIEYDEQARRLKLPERTRGANAADATAAAPDQPEKPEAEQAPPAPQRLRAGAVAVVRSAVADPALADAAAATAATPQRTPPKSKPTSKTKPTSKPKPKPKPKPKA